MYSTRAASGSRPLIPPDSALPPPASVLPPPASMLVPPDSPFLHRRIPDSRFIVAPRAPHITIQFLQGKGSLDLFSLDLPLPASCGTLDPSAIPSPRTEAGNSGTKGKGSVSFAPPPVQPLPPPAPDLNILVGMLVENQTALQKNLVDVMQEVARHPVIEAPALTATPLRGNTVKLRNARIFSRKHMDVTPFLSEIKRIIDFNPASFVDDRSKILFVGLNLKDGIPIEWFNHLENSQSPLLWDWTAFLATFRKKFADPSLITTADQRLDALRQTGSAHYYLTSFMEIASHLDMTEQTKISRFMKGLKPIIKDHLVNIVDRPSTLEAWEPFIISVDTNLHQREVERRLEHGNSYHKRHTKDFNTTAYVPSKTVAPSSSLDVVPMDIDAITPSTSATTTSRPSAPRGKLTAAEREDRFKNNLCLYCGRSGHAVKDCRTRAAKHGTADPRLPISVPRRPARAPFTKAPTGEWIAATTRAPVFRLPNHVRLDPKNRDHFFIAISLHFPKRKPIRTYAFIDCGSSDSHIGDAFATRHSLTRIPKPSPIPIYTIDDRPLTSGLLTHDVITQLKVCDHSERIQLGVVSMPYPVLLGLKWLRQHNPSVNWTRGHLTLSCCGANHDFPVTAFMYSTRAASGSRPLIPPASAGLRTSPAGLRAHPAGLLVPPPSDPGFAAHRCATSAAHYYTVFTRQGLLRLVLFGSPLASFVLVTPSARSDTPLVGSVGLGQRLNNKPPSAIMKVLAAHRAKAPPPFPNYTSANAGSIASILRPPIRNGLSRAELKSIWSCPPPPTFGPRNKPLHIACVSPQRFRKYAKTQPVSFIWYTSNDELEVRINALSFPPSDLTDPDLPPPEPPPLPSDFRSRSSDAPPTIAATDAPPPEPPPIPTLDNRAFIRDTTNEVLTLVPEKYHSFLDVFDPVEVLKLPEHRPYDIAIDLEEGKTPPFGPIYSLAQDERQILFEYVEEQLQKGYIRRSTSSAAGGGRSLLLGFSRERVGKAVSMSCVYV
ncbi:hypothetical protein LshimejAT787_1105290 [Lyophyllum shimeji]|uniref:CCHC-type domain-containing protein n=2 Tax=Lyophyllum shimeji TaxID=47721 RepID=A0A9P3PVV4_LYOSH|nr:hypothetical protein LshimejAT787_1105290 [Lyophyllum shimeji]